MHGDERARQCLACKLTVYNISELTEEEVRALIARSGGTMCTRLYRRSDGTVITKDCPLALGAIRKRLAYGLSFLVAAALTVFAADRPLKAPRGGTPYADLRERASQLGPAREVLERLDPSPFMGITPQ